MLLYIGYGIYQMIMENDLLQNLKGEALNLLLFPKWVQSK